MTDVFLDLFNMSVTASYLVLAVIVARLLLKKLLNGLTVFYGLLLLFALFARFPLKVR